MTPQSGPPDDHLAPVDRRNIVITGFMGTGKSTIAREVAHILGRPLVDMDQVIAERAGMSIAEIFSRYGEQAFRQQERALSEELSTQECLVIATGGGTLVDAGNRELLARNGYLVCLDGEVDELLLRLRGKDDRPMLWDEDPSRRLRDLLHSRQPAYAEIPYHLHTGSQPPTELAQEVIELTAAEPRVWRVATPTGSYPVYLLPGGLRHLGPLLRARGISSKVMIVSDEHVWPLHGSRLLAGLQASRYTPTPIILPAGEQHKNLDTVRLLYDQFIEAGLERSGAVIAIGGGVVTDMVGFASATYMRGVPLVPVPTTLLGMVDASVGGKVAVDHPRGKNLVGAFVQPLLVMLDPAMLSTLPELEHRAGLAEVIKAGIIADAELFAYLEAQNSVPAPPSMRWLVERALAVKIAVVEEDPYERGRRAVLNLGHTFAHALEVVSSYQLHHGLAVSLGIVAAAHLAEARGLMATGTRERIVATLGRHGLPTRYAAYPPQVIYGAMQSDKKKRGAALRFVLPRDIGDVVIVDDVSESQVIQALERIRS